LLSVFGVPKEVVAGRWEVVQFARATGAAGGRERDLTNEMLSSKDLVKDNPHSVDVLFTNLDED